MPEPTKPPASDPGETGNPVPTVADIRKIVATNLADARKTLSTLRGKRDALNKEISHQVAEVEELERVDRQLNAKPRTKKAK